MRDQTEAKPNVSIIMPTYNRGETLPRAIQSVLDQLYQHFELIIIDDGSDDNTEQAIRSIQDPRINYVRSNHKGASAARNIGIAQSKFRYIAFLDSDDEWHPDFLSTLLDILINAVPQIGVVFCGYWYFSESEKIYKPQACTFEQGDILPELLRGNFVALPAAMIKKECISTCGDFDETLPCRHDWELWIRISEKWEFQYVDKPLLNVYKTQNSISVNRRYMLEGWAPLIQKHLNVFSNKPEILASHYLKIAHSLWYPPDREEFKILKHYTLKALWISPKKIKPYFHLLLASMLGYSLYSFYHRMKIKQKG